MPGSVHWNWLGQSNTIRNKGVSACAQQSGKKRGDGERGQWEGQVVNMAHAPDCVVMRMGLPAMVAMLRPVLVCQCCLWGKETKGASKNFMGPHI